MQKNIWNDQNLIKILSENGAAVMPTDTIYGLVGKALEKKTVERIYNVKKRTFQKPFIILIGNIKQLNFFSIFLSKEQKSKLKEFWRNNSIPISIILDCPDNSFTYLHRGIKTLAFRLPTLPALRNLLIRVGPLIAPSANLETLPPSKTIFEAKKYFSDKVDIYVDGGEINNRHSKIIQLHKDGLISIIRE